MFIRFTILGSLINIGLNKLYYKNTNIFIVVNTTILSYLLTYHILYEV